MRKNERLIGIRPYQTSTGDWHFELTDCQHVFDQCGCQRNLQEVWRWRS